MNSCPFPMLAAAIALSAWVMSATAATSTEPPPPAPAPAPATIGAAQTTQTPAADTRVWLAHRLVVAPFYPSALAKARVTGVVDAQLRISPSGEIVEILHIESNPAHPAFVTAVRDVLSRWMFRKELDPQCEPRVSEGWLRVIFELRGDEPVVSVWRPVEPRWEPARGPSINNRRKLGQTLLESFPREGRRARVGALVAVAVDVDGNTGAATRAKATAVDLDWGHASGRLEVLYAAAAEEAVSGATFAVPPANRDKIVRSCLVVNYRVKEPE